MGTEVLRPQDCLIEWVGVSPAPSYRRRNFYNPNPNFNNHNFNSKANRRTYVRSDYKLDQRRKQPSPPSISRRSTSADDFKVNGNHQHHHRLQRSGDNSSVGVERVTILRRGESLDSKIKSSGIGEIVGLTSPATGKCDVYAGSAFFVSPAPSSLPLPSFSTRSSKNQLSVDDSATRDLRRLLRLDF